MVILTAFCAFISIGSILNSDLLLFWTFFIVLILVLYSLCRKAEGLRTMKRLKEYKPLKGFRFFRKTSEQRIHQLRVQKMILLLSSLILILFIFIPIPHFTKSAGQYAVAVALILYFYFKALFTSIKKDRIKFHRVIDDASYFELEELGLISEKDVVISLYKDFSSWKDVKETSKLLILTQDSFICLDFLDRYHADKLTVPLSKITAWEFFNYLGCIIIKFQYSGVPVRTFLESISYEDSPEEFIARLLKQMDNCLLNRQHDEVKTYNKANYIPPENLDHIRQIDITNYQASTSESTESNNSSRIIEL